MHGIRFFYHMDISIWHSRKPHWTFQGFSTFGSSRKTRISKTSSQHRYVLSKFAFGDSSLGLDAVTIFSNFKVFCFFFKFNKFCDFSLNSTRYTKIHCLNDFSVRCVEIYNFMLIDQQAPACRFYKIYKIYDFSLTSRFFNKSLLNLRFIEVLCNANSTYWCRPADFIKFAIFRN